MGLQKKQIAYELGAHNYVKYNTGTIQMYKSETKKIIQITFKLTEKLDSASSAS